MSESSMRLGNIRPAAGATKDTKRRGKGAATGLGGTAGKGHKGKKARSGGKIPVWFEGGQMPIQRRLPKVGFKNHGRVEFQVVNLISLAKFSAGETVNRATLKAKRLVDRSDLPVKVLGVGEITAALTVVVDGISASAKGKIEAAGGTVTLPTPKTYRPRGVRREAKA